MPHFTISTHAFTSRRTARSPRAFAWAGSRGIDQTERGERARIVFAPAEAPIWIFDLEKLWTLARSAERRRSAPYALTLTLDLPRHGTEDLCLGLVEVFARESFTDHGRAVDAVLVAARRSSLARIAITTRRVDAFGIGERLYPLPDAQQLIAWERSWNRLCARSMYGLLLGRSAGGESRVPQGRWTHG